MFKLELTEVQLQSYTPKQCKLAYEFAQYQLLRSFSFDRTHHIHTPLLFTAKTSNFILHYPV